jgi:hypothetical protein
MYKYNIHPHIDKQMLSVHRHSARRNLLFFKQTLSTYDQGDCDIISLTRQTYVR